MRSLVRIWLGVSMLAGTLALGSACVVRETVVARPGPPPRCPGGVWIPEHYGRYGRYHHGHWRCPGVIEVE